MISHSKHIVQVSNTEKHQDIVPLHGLATLQILIILAIAIGYASTMSTGSEYPELGQHWGYDPSWFGIQMLFIFSGFLAVRSMTTRKSVVGFLKSRILRLWPSLLAVTLFSVCIVYPFMCAADAPVRMSIAGLTTYTFKTIFLIEPAARMPGLMDNAEYMCLLQGAIWTLRIGFLLHLAFLLGWVMRILQNRKIVLGLCAIAIALYVTLVDIAVDNPELGAVFEVFLPVIRLGYAYLIGITLFLWQDKLRLNLTRLILSAALIALLTTASYTWLHWSSALEVMGVTMWFMVCLAFLHGAPRALQHCPRLAPALYVSIWPAAQIVTAIAPETGRLVTIEISIVFAVLGAGLIHLLLRQARIQTASF